MSIVEAVGSIRQGGVQLQFAVGFKLQGKTGHVIVDAEDALVAALKVRIPAPGGIDHIRPPQNKRGDTRHPVLGLPRASH